MDEAKAQRVKRLRREIDEIEERARRQMEAAERKRERLALIEARPAPPSEANMMHVRVKFRQTATIYTFLIVQTPMGYYTTGTYKNSHFSTWDSLLDWLESPDVQWHSGIEMLALTGEVAYPARTSEASDEARFIAEIGKDYS